MTGFRKGEALGLEWKDIDFNEGVIRLWNEKDNREDVFQLFPELIDFLSEFRTAKGKVFPFSVPVQIARVLKKEFGYSFKDFRSTFASEKAKDFRAYELKELLRHKKVQTSEKYYVNVDVRSLSDRL
jgi:integrase